MFFRFPPDAHWNAVSGVVEFGIGISVNTRASFACRARSSAALLMAL